MERQPPNEKFSPFNPQFFNSQRFHHRAFTLVEIMVAIAVFSIIIAANLFDVDSGVALGESRAGKPPAQVQRQRIAVRTIEDSLSCIQSFQASMQYYSFIVQNGDQPVLSFTSRCRIFPAQRKIRGFQSAPAHVHRRTGRGQ